jgi:hypothetical protein
VPSAIGLVEEMWPLREALKATADQMPPSYPFEAKNAQWGLYARFCPLLLPHSKAKRPAGRTCTGLASAHSATWFVVLPKR